MPVWEKLTTEVTGGDERLQEWLKKIDRSIKKRRPHAKEWKRNHEYISLKRIRDHDPEEDGDLPAVNKTRAYIKNRVASFVYKNPRFMVRPVNPGSADVVQVPTGQIDPQTGQPIMREVEKHRVAEHLLNFVFSQPSFGADRTARRFAIAGLTSLGVTKVGFKAEFGNGYETEELYAFDEESGTFLRNPAMSPEPDERGVPMNLVPTDNPEYGKPYPLMPTSEMWFWDWVPPHRMLIDPDGENEFYEHDWVGLEYYVPLKELQESDEFPKKLTKRLKGTLKADDFSEEDIYEFDGVVADADEFDDDTEYVRLFMIHDIKNRKILLIADGLDEFLLEKDYPDGLYHSPYVFFRPDEELGEFYQHPVVSDLVPINQEIDKIHSLILASAYGNTPKWGYVEGDLDDDQLDVLMSPVPNEAIKFNKLSTGNPKDSLFPIDRQYQPPDLYQMLAALERAFDEVATQSGEDRGVASSKLATGVAAITASKRNLEDDYRAMFAAALREVGKKLLDSIQANMTREMAIAITGPDGEVFTGNISPEMIQGDFDVAVDIEDLMPRSTEAEMANIIQMANLFGQYPILGVNQAVSGALLDKARMNSAALREGLQEVAQTYLQLQMGPQVAQMLNQQGDQTANASPNADAQGGAGPVTGEADMLKQMTGRMGGM